MREIKFRGKQVAYHRPWIYGSLLMLDGKAYILDDEDTSASINPSRDPESGTTYVEGLVEVDPSTIGQYTGLKDSNGKDIYEGDILNVVVIRPDFVVHEYQTDVRFEDGSFVIKGEGSEYHNTFLCAYINPNVPIVEIEIIGNIHDNPELLEEGGER